MRNRSKLCRNVSALNVDTRFLRWNQWIKKFFLEKKVAYTMCNETFTKTFF